MRSKTDIVLDYENGRALSSFAKDELGVIGRWLMATTPAYWNPKDPRHPIAQETVCEVYEALGAKLDAENG